MAKTKTGALIVIERTNALDFLINTGDSMNALGKCGSFRKCIL